MLTQLRRYRVRPEEWDTFVDLFYEHLAPARQAYGFELLGAWGDREDGTFVWLVSHEAPDGWDAAERAYYEGPERAALPRDPKDLLLGVDTKVLHPLER